MRVVPDVDGGPPVEGCSVTLGDVIDTPLGPATITGCDAWPDLWDANTVPKRCRVSAITGDGETVLLAVNGDDLEVL